MKNLVITAKKLRKEILISAVCFIAAFIINIISIIIYKTPWYEIFTQIGYILVITLLFYIFAIVLRLIIFYIRKLVVSIKRDKSM